MGTWRKHALGLLLSLGIFLALVLLVLIVAYFSGTVPKDHFPGAR
jgi:hypothetical protein